MRWPWHHHPRHEQRAREALKSAHADAALLKSREPHLRELIGKADAVTDKAVIVARAKREQAARNHLGELFDDAIGEGL